MTLKAEVPMLILPGKMIVPARIEGTPVSMIVDTGAPGLTLTREAADLLRTDRDPGKWHQGGGIGGEAEFPVAVLDSFEFADLKLRHWRAAIFSFTATRPMKPVLAGLIGGEILSQWDVELDWGAHLVRLYQVKGCDGSFLPHPELYKTVPARRIAGSKLVVTVSIGDQSINAILDSGADESLLSDTAAMRLGLSRTALARDTIGAARGVDGRVVTYRKHVFGSVRIGSETLYFMPIDIGNLAADPGWDMLLGGSYFQYRRIWVSYATNQIFVLPQTYAR